MRILHGPVNVGNQPWILSRAERRLGASSDLVTRSDTWLKYPADLVLSADSARPMEIAARSVAYGLRKQWRYDVLHFYFGQTFLSPGFPLSKNAVLDEILNRLTTIDLRVARLLGKKLFMTLQGCDVRLAGEGNKRNDWTMCAPQHCEMYQRCLDVLDDRRRYLMNKVLPLFDRVFYLNPELGHVVPNGQFLPYANVEIEKFATALPSSHGKPRIVHAPSAGRIKGTPMILKALQQLRSRYDFDLVVVEKKTHEEALELYRSADLAIDQVLAGWYGGFAVEMMAMGKPVACYIRESDMTFIPEAMKRELPVFKINPGNLVEDIAAILDRRPEWKARGQEARRYVERWHNPELVAEAMLRAYLSPESRFELECHQN
jgi:glycosyltransferase involved in cell wall biosynthesis